MTALAVAVAAGSGCGDSGAAVADDSTSGSEDASAPGDTGVDGSPSDGGTTYDAGAVDDADESLHGGPGAAVTRYRYDPAAGFPPTTLPDDLWAVADPSTETGLRVDLGAAGASWLAGAPATFAPIYEDLDGLDGWGTTAAIQLRFDGPVVTPDAGELPELVRLVALTAAGAEDVPFEVSRPDTVTMLFTPLVPLRPAARYGLVVTTGLLDEAGQAVQTAPALADLLAGEATDGALGALEPRYMGLLEAVGAGPEDVVAAVVFTTQSIRGESVAISADIEGRSYTWSQAPVCAPDGELIVCDGQFEAWSYRVEGELAGTTPSEAYILDVRAWLPMTPGAWPTALFGHGIQHDRSVGKAIAKLIGPLGVTVVAIDAVAHGDHPDAAGEESLDLLEFFGVSLDPLAADTRRLRDNFRQATWDKLQVLRLLDDHQDLDGDGAADLDLGTMAYIGESFGGIMGIELLALSDRFDMVVLQTAGGRVSSIVSEGNRFQIFNSLFTPPDGTLADLLRLYPIVQTVIERGDAANWASWVLGDRLPAAGTTPPHLLFQTVVEDDTIPDVSARLLARALRIPHVPPVIADIGLLDVTGLTPVAGNLAASPGRTAGVFQFDRITRSPGGEVEKASHDYTPGSEEAKHQLVHFVATWLDTGTPEIVDPYEILGTPPLR